MPNRNTKRTCLAACGAAALLALARGPALGQDVQSFVVQLDGSSSMPVGTGFVPADSDGELVLFAEGPIKDFNSGRPDLGWTGPGGHTRFDRAGQPISGGMSHGSLIGGFSDDMSTYRYVGRMGSFHLLPSDAGNEFRVALNMSVDDLPFLQGEVTVAGVFLPDGTASVAQVEIRSNTVQPVGTGLIGARGDAYIVLPYGTLQAFLPATVAGGYFGPEGLALLTRGGQPYAHGVYGGLYAFFNPAFPFYLGDGGTFVAGTPATGWELKLNANLSAADLAGSDGRFVVNVVRIPAAALPREAASVISHVLSEEGAMVR